MKGPCAKKRVHCTLIAEDGQIFQGENSCDNAQISCPRIGPSYSRDDFTLCKTVCSQPGHAEVMALEAAGEKAKGSIVLVSHHRICSDCRKKLIAAGVKAAFTVIEQEL